MKKQKAFTLIEIMIVVVILGILAVALFPKLLGAIGKSSDEARKVELKNWTAILLQYKNDNLSYPESSGECLAPNGTVGAELIADGYVDKSKFPKDPNQKSTVQGCSGYFYYRSLSANGINDNSFMVVAHMENDKKGNATSVPGSVDKEGVENNLGDQGDYYVELGL